MERLIDQFHAIVREFRLKRHDLLDYHNNKFDRDYVEFNVKVDKIISFSLSFFLERDSLIPKIIILHFLYFIATLCSLSSYQLS